MPKHRIARHRSLCRASAWSIERLELRSLLSAGSGDEILIDNGPMFPPGEDGFQVHPTNGRWTTTSAGSTGSVGNPISLTWGFVADGTVITAAGSIATETNAASTLQARLNTLYGSSATWQPVFQAIFDRWSALSGLTFTYRGLSDDGAAFPNSSGNANRADIRIGGHPLDGPSGNNILAYCYYPNTGDMVIDTDNFNAGSFFTNTSNNSRPLRNVLGHELGHGLGFAHVDPINQTKLMEASTVSNPIFDGPQFDDILIAQRQYGDPYEKGGRNEAPATASNLGTLANGTNVALSQWVNANNPTNARSVANTSDADYLKFTITSAKNVSFTVNPFGPTYTQGPQGGATSSFNASSNGNLTLTLYGTDGTTVLNTANATGLGGSETVTASNLPAGTYYVRVGESAGDVQAYNLLSTISSAVAVPPAPSTPDLDVASDSGLSNSDNTTNDTTPTFTGTAEANSTVSILVDGSVVATGTATAGGAYTITTPAISNGNHTITAFATNGAGPGPTSGGLSITIDTVAPQITTKLFQRDNYQFVSTSFDSNVAGTGSLTLTNTNTAQNFVTTPVTVSAATVEYRVTNNVLTDGNYTGTINLAGVTDVAGNTAIGSTGVSFKFLRADIDANNVVNFSDLVILAQNYGQSGRNHAQGNVNYSPDGLVDFSDLVILAQSYNASLLSAITATSAATPTGVSDSALPPGRKRQDGDPTLLS